MPTYITLFRYTQKGAQEIKGGPGRLDAAKQAAKAAGGEVKAFYLTLGQYDADGGGISRIAGTQQGRQP